MNGCEFSCVWIVTPLNWCSLMTVMKTGNFLQKQLEYCIWSDKLFDRKKWTVSCRECHFPIPCICPDCAQQTTDSDLCNILLMPGECPCPHANEVSNKDASSGKGAYRMWRYLPGTQKWCNICPLLVLIHWNLSLMTEDGKMMWERTQKIHSCIRRGTKGVYGLLRLKVKSQLGSGILSASINQFFQITNSKKTTCYWWKYITFW